MWKYRDSWEKENVKTTNTQKQNKQTKRKKQKAREQSDLRRRPLPVHDELVLIDPGRGGAIQYKVLPFFDLRRTLFLPLKTPSPEKVNLLQIAHVTPNKLRKVVFLRGK